MVGVRDLRHAVVVLDTAADDPLGADRQEPRQVVALDVEVDQHQRAAHVGDKNPVGPAPHARLVPLDLGL
jgi:hypothetical protein